MRELHEGDCVDFMSRYNGKPFDLTFLDPPFNQGKFYRSHNDNMNEDDYWNWMRNVCKLIYDKSSDGSSLYFMHREKNAGKVMDVMIDAGWQYRNMIIWKKLAAAVHVNRRYGKAYQIIVYGIKGKHPRTYNQIRIDLALKPWQNTPRKNGVIITDIWEDIRELTSGYFAGPETLRKEDGHKVCRQQAPVALLLRILLASSLPGELVFDPFCGTGTTLVVADQLDRQYIGVEKDSIYCDVIEHRLQSLRNGDNISKLLPYYRYTPNLVEILGNKFSIVDTLE